MQRRFAGLGMGIRRGRWMRAVLPGPAKEHDQRRHGRAQRDPVELVQQAQAKHREEHRCDERQPAVARQVDDLTHLAGQRVAAPGFPSAMVNHGQCVLTAGNAVGQVRVLPKRVAIGHVRQAEEVVGARWQAGGPLQGIRVPRILRRRNAETKVQDDIQQDGCHAHRHDETADRGHQVGHVPAEAGVIGVDAPRHADQARPVHDHEGHVEADEEQPEAPAAELFRGHAPGEVRQPVVQTGH